MHTHIQLGAVQMVKIGPKSAVFTLKLPVLVRELVQVAAAAAGAVGARRRRRAPGTAVGTPVKGAEHRVVVHPPGGLHDVDLTTNGPAVPVARAARIEARHQPMGGPDATCIRVG